MAVVIVLGKSRSVEDEEKGGVERMRNMSWQSCCGSCGLCMWLG